MSIHTNFFADGSTINTASDFIAPWAALLSDGVFKSTDFAVSADSPADLAVSVAAGNAIKNGYFVRSDAAQTVSIAANTSGYNRIDIIVLQADDSAMATALKDVQGTASSSPTPPTLLSNQLPLAQVTVGNNVSVINSSAITDMRYRVLGPGEYPGKLEQFTGSTPPFGRLIADGSAASRTGTTARLFAAIGTTWGAGDGSTTFNLPDLRNRTLIGAGQLTWAATFPNTAINVSTDAITVNSNDSLKTGTPVVLTTSGTAPTGLTAGTTYYVIRLSATSISLASSLANAVAGTAIDITGQGTGNHTLTITYTSRALGTVGGEEVHSLVKAELPSFNLTVPFQNGSTGRNDGAIPFTYPGGSTNTSSVGGNQAFNVMQPYAVVNYIIVC